MGPARLTPGAWRSQEPEEPAPGGQGNGLWHHQDGAFGHAARPCPDAAEREGPACILKAVERQAVDLLAAEAREVRRRLTGVGDSSSEPSFAFVGAVMLPEQQQLYPANCNT